MRQQLATVTKEKNRYAEELKELRKITERPQPAGDQVSRKRPSLYIVQVYSL